MNGERLLQRWAAGGFGAVAALRQGRAVHRAGVGYRARVALGPRLARVWDADEADAVVRLSRGAGLPDPAPDVLGIGLRITAGDGPERPGTARAGAGEVREADLLLASSTSPPVLRHVLVPGRRFDGAWFSSLTPVRLAGDRRVYGARVTGPPALTLATLRRREHQPGPIDLYTAALTGPWEPAGTVRFVDWLDHADVDALALDPWHTTVPLEPVGAFNRVRGAAYAGSRRARRAADPLPLTGQSPSSAPGSPPHR